jgi:hypothetical protein
VANPVFAAAIFPALFHASLAVTAETFLCVSQAEDSHNTARWALNRNPALKVNGPARMAEIFFTSDFSVLVFVSLEHSLVIALRAAHLPLTVAITLPVTRRNAQQVWLERFQILCR